MIAVGFKILTRTPVPKLPEFRAENVSADVLSRLKGIA